MNKKNFIYLARFYPKEVKEFDKIGFKTNFSVNKKVSGVLNSLNSNCNSLGIVSTSCDIPNYNFRRKLIKFKNFDIYIPNLKKSRIRLFAYICNIFNSTQVVNDIYKKNSNTIFISWDCLPDTLLPLLLSKIPRSSICLDIEEEISADPEANIFFKLFELIIFKLIKFRYYFLSNENLIRENKAKNIIINGFFAENEPEEEYILKLLNSYNRKNSDFKVFYSARMDNNRGGDILEALIRKIIQNKQILFNAVVFGDPKLINKIMRFNSFPNINIYTNLNREDYLNIIINSDICLNLLKNTSFTKRSFPSKLIEFFIFSKFIISTHKIYTKHYLNFKYCEYSPNAIFQSIEDIFNIIKNGNYNLSNKDLLISEYSIKKFNKRFKNFFN